MKSKFTYIFLIAVIFTSFSFAGGTDRNPYSSSKTTALNGLYFAGADGIIKSISNPAGLIYLNENGFELSIIDRLTQSKFKNQSNGLYNSFRDDEFIFNAGIILSLSENFKTALSYQRVLNYNVSWPYANYFVQDSLAAFLVFDFFNQLNIDAITASFAYRFGNISIGISPALYNVKSKIAFPQTNPLWINNTGTAAYQFNYDLDAWSYGFNLGAIAEISSDLKVGISVRSSFTADLDGDARSRLFTVTDAANEITSLESKFEMPWIFGFGAVYSSSSNMNFNFDIQYSMWNSTQQNMSFIFGDQIWQSKLNQKDVLSGVNGSNFNLSYNNTFDFGFGFEFISQSNISYRAGYRFSQTPNSEESYNLLFPAVDQHVLSLGAGLGEGNLRFEAAILYAFGTNKKVMNAEIPSLQGEYGYNMIMPMVTMKYLFL